MKKQTIYSYLQRSLVKVLTKSINSNRYQSSLAKPLKKDYASLVSYARPVKKIKKQGCMVFLLAKHKHSKTLSFFRKGKIKKSLRFTCKFSLISFIKPKLAMLLFNAETLLSLTLQPKLKLLKLNPGFFNTKLVFFLSLLHGTHFYIKAQGSNFLFFQAKLCSNLGVHLFFMVLVLRTTALGPRRTTSLTFFYYKCPYRIKTLVSPSLNHVIANFNQLKKQGQGRYFTYLDSFARERFFFHCNYSNAQLLSPSKNKWYLFQNKKKKEKINFYFYTKKPQSNSHSWPFSFGVHKSNPVHQSFYKRKHKSTNYVKTFHNLSDFFNLFYISTNKKISIFDSASLLSQALQTQQVLYLGKILYAVPCFFPVLVLSNTNINYIILLYSFRNQLMRTKKENQISFFKMLPLVTIILYVGGKYIKENKEKDPYEQPTLNVLIYKFHEIIEKKFLSFRPFYGKVVEIDNIHLTDFFLMRPLFSLTRLDTFFICESLKLPIYPDKSNLRVDFLRNRVRKQILPAIRILLNPQFDTILCKFNESAG